MRKISLSVLAAVTSAALAFTAPADAQDSITVATAR